MTAEKPRRLGRGLDALLGKREDATADGIAPSAAPHSALQDIPVSAIHPNRFQPRKEFKAEELDELKESIRAGGLLQPVAVRKSDDGFELVAGERRLRAVKALGWDRVPAIVHDYDDRAMLTLALVENLQRENLNPIEEAEGYARLTADFALTQNEIADLVGKDRSTIANLLRVLQLPIAVRKLLENGDLSLGHARPLLALQDPSLATRLAREAVELGLSVRAIEDRVRVAAPAATSPKRGRPRRPDDRPAEVRHVEEGLRQRLQTDVTVIAKPKGKGELRIQFYSTDDLNRLLDLIGVQE